MEINLIYLLSSEFLHEVFANSPHSCALSVDIHWHSGCQTKQLNASNCYEGVLRTFRFQPFVEEEGEHEAVENV